MDYHIETRNFSFSYQDIKYQHEKFCNMRDEEFLANLVPALHLACFIAWLKELTPLETISDVGIIHELVHLLHHGDNPNTPLRGVRAQFEKVLKLA